MSSFLFVLSSERAFNCRRRRRCLAPPRMRVLFDGREMTASDTKQTCSFVRSLSHISWGKWEMLSSFAAPPRPCGKIMPFHETLFPLRRAPSSSIPHHTRSAFVRFVSQFSSRSILKWPLFLRKWHSQLATFSYLLVSDA